MRRRRRARGALGAALGSLTGALGCVFTLPPPLPEELAAQAAQKSVVQMAPDVENAGTTPEEGETEGTGASEPAFTKGEPPPLEMTVEEMKAYATAQGDPEGGDFTLEEALAGVPGEGDALWVRLVLGDGPIECQLYPQDAPVTVANFVGLARGLRPFLDPATDAWRTGPYYEGTQIHRAIPGFIIQGGDPTGTGLGSAGYVIPDEIVPERRHDRAGVLSMANRGPGSGSSQFFITLGPAPHLDGKHTIFGQCTDASVAVAERIAARANAESQPDPPAEIDSVAVERRAQDVASSTAAEPAPQPEPAHDAATPAKPADGDGAETEERIREVPRMPKF